MSEIMVTTLVGSRDRDGRVQIEGPGIKLQLSPDEARDLAGNIMQAATFAEADAFILNWVMKTTGVAEHHAAVMLREFREFRGAQVANHEQR